MTPGHAGVPTEGAPGGTPGPGRDGGRDRRIRRRRRTAAGVAAGVLLLLGVVIGWAVTAPGGPAREAPPRARAPSVTYTNPVVAGDFPDPDVVRTGSTYVAVATGVGGTNVPVETSVDLATWRPRGDALPVLPAWAVPSWRYVWGPDLAHQGDHWVLWFTAEEASSGRQCIGVATSGTVTGPYHPASAGPVVCQVALGGSIDPSEFVDGKGDRWLLWKNDGNCCHVPSRIWSQPLAADGTTPVGTAVPILSYDGGWEDGGSPLRSTVEGPQLVAADGVLHLFFSGNGYDTADYAVGHALCTSPAGPCQVTSPYPVLSSFGPVAGPGGASVFTDRLGGYWIAYAAWTAPKVGYASGGVRSMRIDRLRFVGTLPVVDGPTATPVRTGVPSPDG